MFQLSFIVWGAIASSAFGTFQNCFAPTPPVLPACAPVHDFDTTDASDGDIDLNDYARFVGCSNGPFVTPDQACGIPQRAGVTPASGVFTLHGRPVDILSDGFVLQDFRSRVYVPTVGRWLQRDPTGYADGVDLYEAFRGNATTNADPLGTEVWAEGRRVKTTLNGVPVWRVDYVLNRDGVSLGIGGLLWRSAVESEHAGTEYFRYTEDLRELRRIDSLIENQRQIVQGLQIANIQVASLEQGIKTAATVAVALPVAAVAAPVASAAFTTTTAGVTTTTIGGNIAATALTGGVSLGVGQATGEALIGGTAGEIVQAGGEGFVVGAVVSAPFGLLAPVGTTSVVSLETQVTPSVRLSPSRGVSEGTQLYRVFGDEAKGLGYSYTTVNPATVPNYRVSAGLYPGNTGRFVLEGTLSNTQGVTLRSSLPGPGGVGGGLPEVIVPNPGTQVIIVRVSGVNPPF